MGRVIYYYFCYYYYYYYYYYYWCYYVTVLSFLAKQVLLLKSLIVGSLCEIDLETAKQLCSKCREQFRNQLRNQDDEPDIYELSSENQQDSESENADYNQSFIVCNSRDALNATLGEL